MRLLTIGLLSTAGYFLPSLLARFQAEHPGVDVRLDVTRDLIKLLDRLHTNEIDLAVMGHIGGFLAGLALAVDDLVTQARDEVEALTTRILELRDAYYSRDTVLDDDATYVAGAREAGLSADRVGGAPDVRASLAAHGLGVGPGHRI